MEFDTERASDSRSVVARTSLSVRKRRAVDVAHASMPDASDAHSVVVSRDDDDNAALVVVVVVVAECVKLMTSVPPEYRVILEGPPSGVEAPAASLLLFPVVDAGSRPPNADDHVVIIFQLDVA